ncbi:MHYT domain-containing protein [Nocardia thailandica]|uniref:MHYT domain-containing protein n=1 Tax=Nocardia thailandica TaxID=257275 RepID=A0ABW6PV66_9NOCA
MQHLEHFSNGWVNPVLAYLVSFIGAVLGLRCAVHAESAANPAGWLTAAAVALGGTGIWVMHFTAMIGFAITGATVRYDVGRTLLSAVMAIVVVLAGLSIVTRGRREEIALPVGGTVTGLGVVAMHYLGMSAMSTGTVITYRVVPVALSVIIAVVASTAALWFMLHVRGSLTTLGAAAIMALAVVGMHYTAMAAVRSHAPLTSQAVDGVAPKALLLPLISAVAAVVVTLVIMVGLAEIETADTGEAAADEPSRTPMLSGTDPAALSTDRRAWPRRP